MITPRIKKTIYRAVEVLRDADIALCNQDIPLTDVDRVAVSEALERVILVCDRNGGYRPQEERERE